MAERPKAKNSLAEQELDKAQEQFDNFDKQVKELTLDRMAAAPKMEVEPQTKLSQKELERSKDIYLKPKRTYPSKEKFNEKFRSDYDFQKEYVCFTAENKEIIGEAIELCIKPFPGCPAEDWVVPVNKPVWGPRYLAERIKGCDYSILIMDENQVNSGDAKTVQWCNKVVVDRRMPRLLAMPASNRKSIFMGASEFK